MKNLKALSLILPLFKDLSCQSCPIEIIKKVRYVLFERLLRAWSSKLLNNSYMAIKVWAH